MSAPTPAPATVPVDAKVQAELEQEIVSSWTEAEQAQHAAATRVVAAHHSNKIEEAIHHFLHVVHGAGDALRGQIGEAVDSAATEIDNLAKGPQPATASKAVPTPTPAPAHPHDAATQGAQNEQVADRIGERVKELIRAAQAMGEKIRTVAVELPTNLTAPLTSDNPHSAPSTTAAPASAPKSQSTTAAKRPSEIKKSGMHELRTSWEQLQEDLRKSLGPHHQ